MENWLIQHKKTTVFLVFLVLLVAWQCTRWPTNDRVWAADQMVLPYAEFVGDVVTVRNIRNFSYRSTADYEPAYYDKTVSLVDLETVDYIVEPFGSIGAAHTFVSFGFGSGDYIAISVEIRKEQGESFSPIKGLLRSYELMYVVADERDVIKLRTNYREDDVYLYPVETTKAHMQQLFIDMLTRANSLKEQPEFYNTLTSNCTTNIADHINKITPQRIPWDPRLLFPANSDELAYELGLLDTTRSLVELRKMHYINEKAMQYADDADFSVKIRE